ncbi:MAG: hypothetical protein ACP5UA_05545 [Candidatus Hydrogenedens sp.]
MRTIWYLVSLFFVYYSSAFSLENSKPCVHVNITQKNYISGMDITFPSSENTGSCICLHNTVEDAQIIRELQISFDTNLTHSEFSKNKKYIDIRKIENLHFKVISWNEEMESPTGKEIWKYYFVLLKPSSQVLFWVEGETEIKSCILNGADITNQDIPIIEGKNSLLFTSNNKIQSLLTPIFPVTFEKIKEPNNIYCIKSSNYTPNIFGFLLGMGTNFTPFIELHPSDIGPEYGVLIDIISRNPAMPSYNVLLAPGDIVTTYNKKRFEFWGKSCIIEQEKGVYNIIGFIDTHAFTYKDKFNQWSIAFYTPLNGYLQLNGKLNTLFSSLVYGDPINSGGRIKGLCKIENNDYFVFEIPSCIESRIPFPEQIILELTAPKRK